MTLLGGGGRHLVYAVNEGACKAALKIYETPANGRDAFAREMAVHDVLAEFVPQSVPGVLGRDPALRCVLFSWLDGRKPDVGEIGPASARKMALFAAAINAGDVRSAARRVNVPDASDAAFSLSGHIAVAGKRIDALRAAKPHGALGDELEDFLANELQPALDNLERGNRCDSELSDDERVLSASDFGFHNVIVRSDGGFSFFDFEHAGWDDPAKMAADFILQPECLLDEVASEAFVQELESSGRFPRGLQERIAALLPVQAVKWTTIVLNVFQRPDQTAEVLAARLAKARRYWRQTAKKREIAASRR
jgi:hypothetical protein